MFQISRSFSLILIPMLVLSCILSSCEQVLLQTDISDKTVILNAPADGASLDFTSINFNWTAIEDASQYRFQLATPDFDNANQILEDIVLDSITQYTLVLNENEYQWRVQALNNAYKTEFSEASFSVVSNNDFSSNTVLLNAPEDNLITSMDTYILTWNEVPDATGYRVQILENSSQTLVDEMELTDTQYEYTFAEGEFVWQVRAEKDAEATLYSIRNILVDKTPPNIVTLIAPMDEEVLTINTVDFQWSRELIEGSVEFDSLYIYSDLNLETLVEKEEVTGSYSSSFSNGTYYWLMQGFDMAGNQGSPSETFSFTIN